DSEASASGVSEPGFALTSTSPFRLLARFLGAVRESGAPCHFPGRNDPNTAHNDFCCSSFAGLLRRPPRPADFMKRNRTTSSPRNPSGLKRLLLGAAAAGAAFLASAEPDARGKQLYNNCVICHGEDGSGSKLLNAPALAGLSEKYIVAQLQKFKAGHRGGDVRDITGLQMRPMAQTLTSEADVQQVAAYIASLPRAKPPATLSGDPERGKMLYATCQACHNADGTGNDLLN